MSHAKHSEGFDGFIDHVDEDFVVGWAWNPKLPSAPIELEGRIDGVVFSRWEAGLYRADLEQAGKGDGRHAFEISLPPALKDGQQHQFRIVYSGSNIDVPGSPRLIKPDGAIESQAAESAAGASLKSYRSKFGGFWTDLPNASAVIEGKRSLGWISDTEATLLRQWVENGFVVLKQAVPHDWIDWLDEEVEQIWTGRAPVESFVEFWNNGVQTIEPAGPSFVDKRVKLLDLYVHSQTARQIIFSSPMIRFLTLVFERPLVAFQSLYFRWGSQQDIHQDSAFVRVSSPLEFAASWIALEDIQPESGELEYYVGSHLLDDYLFEGKAKWMPRTGKDHYLPFIKSLQDRAESRGLELQQFRPQKGDALIWTADLAHGGSKQALEGRTRKSIVTHYCPSDCEPVYAEVGEKYPRQQFADNISYTVQPREFAAK
ncbi:MAG TPA: phytanoyl-CoA dioxygenase family protein [Pyrinomonadaceae bacterium]|nr:phytanoyl-CoA dioxygenase family protein [Pyrinomonadaceae bacterium]